MKATVIYDGECGFCNAGVARIRRADRHGLFDFVPRQTPGLEERFSALREGGFDSGMRLIDADGRVYVGADAVYHIHRRLPGYRRVAWLYRVPVLHQLARLGYAWIAANRKRLMKNPGSGCRLPAKDAPR